MTRTKNAALVDIRTRELAGAELFDICALQAAALDDVRLAFPARLGHTHSVGIDIFAGAVAKTCLVDRRDVLGAILQHIGLMAADEALRHVRDVELGRASCRERVCQYV